MVTVFSRQSAHAAAAMLLLAGPVALAAPVSATGPGLPDAAPTKAASVAANVNYDLDVALLYADALARPGAAAAVGSGAVAQTAATREAPRALGLRRLRLGLSWQAGDAAAFRLILRPDAVNRVALGEPYRGVDTRAGESYRPEPEVRLADAYELTLRPMAALSASVGVFEELFTPRRSYPALLDFGLQVRFPAKFSGLRFDWQPRGETAPWTAALQVFQGDEDRAEALSGRDDDSFDRAPVAADPYQGVAASGTWQAGADLALSFLGGFYDTALTGGRRSEVLAALGGSLGGRIGGRAASYSLDVRYAGETWRGAALDIAARQQYSAELTAAAALTGSVWGLAGVGWGVSERDPSVVGQTPGDDPLVVTGYELNAGLLRTVGEGLSVQLMLTHERRTQRSGGPGGTSSGAFASDDDESATLRRFGLQLTYLLNDNV